MSGWQRMLTFDSAVYKKTGEGGTASVCDSLTSPHQADRVRPPCTQVTHTLPFWRAVARG
jgi:hypothetical protein